MVCTIMYDFFGIHPVQCLYRVPTQECRLDLLYFSKGLARIAVRGRVLCERCPQ